MKEQRARCRFLFADRTQSRTSCSLMYQSIPNPLIPPGIPRAFDSRLAPYSREFDAKLRRLGRAFDHRRNKSSGLKLKHFVIHSFTTTKAVHDSASFFVMVSFCLYRKHLCGFVVGRKFLNVLSIRYYLSRNLSQITYFSSCTERKKSSAFSSYCRSL